jgi:DNA-binding GntR family transcriptional regulator
MTEITKHTQKNSSVKRQEIVDNLKSWITTLKPNQRLVEISLCERFGIKRSMVREALRQLEHDGFVKIIPHVGAIVNGLSQKDIENTYDLIGVLEGLAARVATPTITSQHLEMIEALINKMQVAENAPLFFDYNKEFHSFLTSLCEIDRLIKFAENLRDQIWRFYLRGLYHSDQIQRANNEHRKIFEAIKMMKPLKVEMFVRDHYLRSKNRLIKYMNKSL